MRPLKIIILIIINSVIKYDTTYIMSINCIFIMKIKNNNKVDT